MKPQVGYLVQYHAHPTETHKNNGSLLAAAVITRVWGDECVNLKVLYDGSENEWKTSVMLGKEAGQWSPIELHLEVSSEVTPNTAAAPVAVDDSPVAGG